MMCSQNLHTNLKVFVWLLLTNIVKLRRPDLWQAVSIAIAQIMLAF